MGKINYNKIKYKKKKEAMRVKRLISLALIALIFSACLPFGAFADDEKQLTVIAFGDSITAADQWQKYIENEYGIDIINAGVGGDTTNSAKSRFKKDVLDKSPDIVIISLGVNDCAIDMTRYVSLEDYKENMGYYIDECKSIGAKVIVNIPTPVVDAQYLTRHDSEPFEPYGGPNGIVTIYAEACREVARAKNVVYADINAAFLATDNYTVYFPDGVHPNATGYKLYAEAVLAVYQQLWLGDINGDGAVDTYDYMLVKRLYFGTIVLDKHQTVRADINIDGVVDTFDFLLAKRAYFGTYTILGR